MTLTKHMQFFHPVKALASLPCQQELLPDHTSVAAHLMSSISVWDIKPYKQPSSFIVNKVNKWNFLFQFLFLWPIKILNRMKYSLSIEILEWNAYCLNINNICANKSRDAKSKNWCYPLSPYDVGEHRLVNNIF
jgi:hypothetical protein